MTLDDLNTNLNKAISRFETDASKACQYCDESTGDALCTMRTATSKALNDFKNEILAYLKQN